MDRRKNFQCCKCGRNNNRATRFVCLSCGEVFCKICYNEPEEINNHKLNHPVQQVLSKYDLELFYGGTSKKSVPVLVKEQPITCPCCGEKGLSSSDLIEHMIQQHHSKNSIKVLCPLCLCGFEGTSKEPEFYGKNIFQHLCIYHQLMPYYDDEDDDDADEQNDDDDDDEDDEYDEPHDIPANNKVENKLHSAGQKRHLMEHSSEALTNVGPGGDGYAVRKSITFLNIEGEPFTFGDDYENASMTAMVEVGAGDSKNGLINSGADSVQVEPVDHLPNNEQDQNGFQIGSRSAAVPSEDSSLASGGRSGLMRRNAMRFLRGQGTRQRLNDPLTGGRSRVFLNNCDTWDIGAFISSHDQSAQRSKRNTQSRGSSSKVGGSTRGGCSNSLGGRRSEMGSNLRHHFDDLLEDCVASSFLRDSSIATELLTYMTMRRRQETSKNSNSAGTSSFEDQRLESDRIWKNVRRTDGSAGDKNKDKKLEKKQRVSDGSELWSQAFDYDNMEYIADQEPDFDHYDEFYEGTNGYEFVDGDEDDDYGDNDDDDDDDDDDNEDDDDDEDEVEEERFEANLKNMKEKNIIKFMLMGDRTKSQTSKQPEREMTSDLDKQSDKDKEKFLLNNNFWREYHNAQEERRVNESLESTFIQELFLSTFNVLSLAEDLKTTDDCNEMQATGFSTERNESDGDFNNPHENDSDGNGRVTRKGDNKQNSSDVSCQKEQTCHKTEGKVQKLVQEAKPAKFEVVGNGSLSPHSNSDSLLRPVLDVSSDGSLVSGSMTHFTSVPLEIKPSKDDESRNSFVDPSKENVSTVVGPNLNNHLEMTACQPMQNNYGARPKDRSYQNTGPRNSLSGAMSFSSQSQRPSGRRSSSGFVSSSSKASSSSSSLLSSTQENTGSKRKSSKNSSIVSSNSNISDFSSPSAIVPPTGSSLSSIPLDEANGGILHSDAMAPFSTHLQGRQPRNDNHHPASRVAARPQATVSSHKKLRPSQLSHSSIVQSSNAGTRNLPPLSNKGITQQHQRGNRLTSSSLHPPLKSGKSLSGSSGGANNSNNNSGAPGTAVVLPSSSNMGSSSNNNVADNSRSNKPCNNTRNKSFLSQKDKTSFR